MASFITLECLASQSRLSALAFQRVCEMFLVFVCRVVSQPLPQFHTRLSMDTKGLGFVYGD
ncbi:rCG60767 [Rattus norvegicus]|uniref:RCG60767 n=1 Tax=Rattus norvegicus TaxID=10116 RepID=A6JKY0_RAT|nr:rCG60767 [Rattus norvegicus]